jgi:hypothetical protein
LVSSKKQSGNCLNLAKVPKTFARFSAIKPNRNYSDKNDRTLRKSENGSTIKREDVMDDNKIGEPVRGSGAPSRRLTREEEEELFAAIITAYLKDEIELEIYPRGISIKENPNPSSREIFFPFEEE